VLAEFYEGCCCLDTDAESVCAAHKL